MSERPEPVDEPEVKKQKVEEECDSDEWRKFSTVGEEHNMLATAYVGAWDYKVEFYMVPGKPPMVSSGTSEFKTIMDGLYVEGTYRGKADFGPTPFSGKDLLGYDMSVTL